MMYISTEINIYIYKFSKLTAPDVTQPRQTAHSKLNKAANCEPTFNNQLATPRAVGQNSLMNLTTSSQRAVIMKGWKQVAQARRDAHYQMNLSKVRAKV